MPSVASPRRDTACDTARDRAAHRRAQRRRGNFATVACTALALPLAIAAAWALFRSPVPVLRDGAWFMLFAAWIAGVVGGGSVLELRFTAAARPSGAAPDDAVVQATEDRRRAELGRYAHLVALALLVPALAASLAGGAGRDAAPLLALAAVEAALVVKYWLFLARR